MPSRYHTYPFPVRDWPFFYGWTIAVVATIGVLMSVPGQTMGMSVFTNHFIAATGLSRLQLSNTYLTGTVLSALLMPTGGVWLDRWGARNTALFACGLLSTTLIYLANVDHIIHITRRVTGGVASHAIGLTLVTLGFVSLRFSGQGLLTMVSRTMLGKWFDKKRGLIAGLCGIVTSFGFATAPIVLQALVDAHGWRHAWLWLAVAIGVGMSGIAWLFFRDNPEECGLRMDGDAVPGGAQHSAPTAERRLRDYNRAEAIRTRAFWAVTLAVALQAMFITGITFHIIDLGASVKLSAQDAVSMFLPMAVVSIGTNFVTGYASDRVKIRYLLFIMAALQCMGCWGAHDIAQPLSRGATIVGLGGGSGMFTVLTLVALPRFFGRTYLGSIAGLQMMCIVAGSAIGPSILALSRQWLGDYTPALLVFAITPLSIVFLAAISKNPEQLRAARSRLDSTTHPE